jgi:hypothetical protein
VKSPDYKSYMALLLPALRENGHVLRYRLRRKVIFVRKNIVGLSLILIVVGLAAAQKNVPLTGGVFGVVRYPDGSPSPHARVSASTKCEDDLVTRLNIVKTASDGSFYVPPFLSSHCNRILLRAEKREDFWLRTGRELFYEGDNGTTPEVDAPRTGKPVLTEINLGKQGGMVNIRVRDISSDRFIWAELRLERVPAPEAAFNAMDITTNSSDVLLPAAQYNVFLESYSCHGKNYFTDGVSLEPLTVKAAERITKDYSIDLRAIKPRRSSENPKGEPCES